MERTGRADAEAGAAVAPLARALRDSKASLTYRWLERIEQRVAVDAGEVFPTEDLLNHVPLLASRYAEFREGLGCVIEPWPEG